MAWGNGGEELREEMHVELAMARRHMYRYKQAVEKLKHEEKRTELLKLYDKMEEIHTQIGHQLNR